MVLKELLYMVEMREVLLNCSAGASAPGFAERPPCAAITPYWIKRISLA
jgi:hypothetical protein